MIPFNTGLLDVAQEAPPSQPSGLQGLLGGGKLDLGLLGMSLLANNNSKSFGRNLGNAGLTYFQLSQQQQRQKAVNDLRDMQMKLAQSRMNLQETNQQRIEQQYQDQKRRQEQYDEAVQQANTDSSKLTFAQKMMINPQAATQSLFPKQHANNQLVFDDQGKGWFANRMTMEITPATYNDKQIVGAKYSPSLQGSIAESKEAGKSKHQMYDGIDGWRGTKKQAVDMAQGGNMPQQPPAQTQPSTGYSNPLTQQDRDATALQILQSEYANETNPFNKDLIAKEIKRMGGAVNAGVGIKVPTKAEQAAQVEAAKLNAKDSNADQVSLKEMERSLPNLEKLVTELSDLGKKATYTMAGQAVDNVRRQLGLEVGDGAIARREYIAKVDNEILPLLRQTFGAAFTAKEGESLKATLGDVDASPEEKDAVLRAFISTKRAQVAGMKRDGVQQIMPSNEPMPAKRSREDILKQYGAI